MFLFANMVLARVFWAPSISIASRNTSPRSSRSIPKLLKKKIKTRKFYKVMCTLRPRELIADLSPWRKLPYFYDFSSSILELSSNYYSYCIILEQRNFGITRIRNDETSEYQPPPFPRAFVQYNAIFCHYIVMHAI